VSDDAPLVALARQMRYDLTALQGKVSELLRQLDELDLQPPVEVRCPDCGWSFTRLSTMQTHRYHHHAGPLPDTWAAEDARVAEEVRQ
jgi:hypothetical protein